MTSTGLHVLLLLGQVVDDLLAGGWQWVTVSNCWIVEEEVLFIISLLLLLESDELVVPGVAHWRVSIGAADCTAL